LQPGEARVETPIVPRRPRYSPLVYVIRLTEERRTVSYVCIRTRSGEVHAGGCFAALQPNERCSGSTALQHLITRALEGVGSVCPELPQQRLSFGTKVPFTLDSSSLLEAGNPRCVMTTLQAICLGAMLAWTPSLVVLALLLREAPLDELQHDPS
jgi:hypothetical protein